MVVFVEQSVTEEVLLLQNSEFMSIKNKLMIFTEKKDDLTDKIDFIICLGGDGTLLYASLLFQVWKLWFSLIAFHLEYFYSHIFNLGIFKRKEKIRYPRFFVVLPFEYLCQKSELNFSYSN